MVYDFTIHERIIKKIAKKYINKATNDKRGLAYAYTFVIGKGNQFPFLKGTGADDNRSVEIEVYPYIDSFEDTYINCGCQSDGENLSYTFAELDCSQREEIIRKFYEAVAEENDENDIYATEVCPICGREFIAEAELKVVMCPYCECYTPFCFISSCTENCTECCLYRLADDLNYKMKVKAFKEMKEIALSHKGYGNEIPFYLDESLPKITCDGEIVTGIQFYTDNDEDFSVFTANPRKDEPDLLLECHLSKEEPYLMNKLLYITKRFDWVVAENHKSDEELRNEIKSLARNDGDLASGLYQRSIRLDVSSSVPFRTKGFEENFCLLGIVFLTQKNEEPQKVLVTYCNADDPREVHDDVIDYQSIHYTTLESIKSVLSEKKNYTFSGTAKVTINNISVEARSESEAMRIAKEQIENELTLYGETDTQFNDIESEIYLALKNVG